MNPHGLAYNWSWFKMEKNKPDKKENQDCRFSTRWNDKNLGKPIVVDDSSKMKIKPVISYCSPNNALH